MLCIQQWYIHSTYLSGIKYVKCLAVWLVTIIFLLLQDVNVVEPRITISSLRDHLYPLYLSSRLFDSWALLAKSQMWGDFASTWYVRGGENTTCFLQSLFPTSNQFDAHCDVKWRIRCRSKRILRHILNHKSQVSGFTHFCSSFIDY